MAQSPARFDLTAQLKRAKGPLVLFSLFTTADGNDTLAGIVSLEHDQRSVDLDEIWDRLQERPDYVIDRMMVVV